MANNLTLTDLPIDIIYCILKDKTISCYDMLKLSETCKKLNTIIEEANFLWRKKCFDICPLMKESYETYCKNGGDPIVSWKKCLQCYQEFYKLYFKHITREEDSDNSHLRFGPWLSQEVLKKFDDLIDTNHGASPVAFQIIWDQLKKLKDREPSYFWDELERINQLQIYIMEAHVAIAWRNFSKLPPSKQIIEECGLLALQLFYVYKDFQLYNFRKRFDVLAEETKLGLMNSWPEYPSFSTPRKKMKIIWRKNVAADNQCDELKSTKISQELCNISFKKTDYMLHETVCDPLAIAIMYEGAARRLGVRCTQNISSIILNEKENCSKSHYISWYERFLSAIKDLPDCKAALKEEIERVTIAEGFEARHQFLFEQINLIEIPNNVDDFLELAKLYIILRMVNWSIRPFNIKRESLCTFNSIINQIYIWLTTWDSAYSYKYNIDYW